MLTLVQSVRLADQVDFTLRGPVAPTSSKLRKLTLLFENIQTLGKRASRCCLSVRAIANTRRLLNTFDRCRFFRANQKSFDRFSVRVCFVRIS